MGRKSMTLAGPLGPGTSSDAPPSQILWHACRGNLPPARAVLTRTAAGCELLVTFGNMAGQRMPFTTALAAVRRAEDLLCKLESVGYRRCRPPRDSGDTR
jgi:hypothetical protein